MHQSRRWDRDFRAVRRAVEDGLLGVVFNVETFVGGSHWSSYRDAIAFAILILILLFKPSGLLGKGEIEKV